ncbi:MAG: flagellar motor switch protein FliG [Longimicrobiales bacterium]
MAVAAAQRRKGGALRADRLTGGQKAAILVMALGPEAAESMTGELTPDELEAISLEMAQLDQVPPEVVATVMEEWQESAATSHTTVFGGFKAARTFLEKTLGKQESQPVMQRLQTTMREGAGFKTLRRVDPESLANILRSEHPQTVALVLAHLEPSLVAEILMQLQPQLGADVLVRKAQMEKVLPDVLEVVERFLGGEASTSLSAPLTEAGGPAAVADVLNMAPPAVEKELLEEMANRDPVLADKIKDLMFVFDDLSKLDEKAIQRLVSEVQTKELAMAMKAGSDELKEKIFRSMSQRAMGTLKQEMEFLGPARLRDVEEAQRKIVAEARRLEEAGEIVLGGGDDELLV